LHKQIKEWLIIDPNLVCEIEAFLESQKQAVETGAQ
jgi:hypothetical protein